MKRASSQLIKHGYQLVAAMQSIIYVKAVRRIVVRYCRHFKKNSRQDNYYRDHKRQINSNHLKKCSAGIILTGCMICLLPGCGKDAELYTRTDVAMGTVITESVYSSGEDVTSQVIQKLSDIENQYLSWRVEGSEIAKINDHAGKRIGLAASEKMASYLEKILEIAAKSDGAFDPTLGEISKLWDIDGANPAVPQKEQLENLLKYTGYEKINLSSDRLVKLEEGISIDLGAAGKGIGCDEAAAFLKKDKAIEGAVISVGGSSIVTYGAKPDGTPWKVAVTDPRNEESGYMGVLTLEGEHYISTSGDYEKYFIENGIRYHHILNSETGYPSDSGLISVTILCDNGLLSDGISTACFVLGREKSLPLLEAYGAEAVFVDKDKNVYLTEGMKPYFTLAQDEYQIVEDW